MRCAVAAVFMLLAGSSAHAQYDRNQPEKTFSKRGTLSPIVEQAKRLKWSKAVLEDKANDYAIARESFRVFLPKRYSAKKTYGLLVWVSPGELGVLPPSWEKYLSRRKLIGIGANDMGNDRPVPCRVGLALDAVWNMQQQHTIDAERIYVTGFSGGGNVASMLAFHYPDVFRGGIYIGGTLYLRNIPVPGTRRYWAGGMATPKQEFLDLLKQRSRHVWICGAKDEQAVKQAKAAQALSVEDGFRHSTYIHVPKLGHDVPNGKYMDRCLKLLDHPKKGKKKKKGEKKKGEKTGEGKKG